MGDSDSGVSSVSSGRTTSSSLCGDDRSTSGSRSSAASLSLSEVSSPTPSSSSSSSSSSQQHQEPVKVWRDPLTVDGGPQVRHVQSVQHHSLMMTPAGHSFQPLPSHVSLLLPPPIYPPEMWGKQATPGGQRFEDSRLTRERRDIEYRGSEKHKEIERERMDRQVQHQQQQSHERQDKQSCTTAEQAVSKHFEESLRNVKDKHMHSAWTLNTLPPQNPVPHLSHISIPAHIVPSVSGIQTSVVDGSVSVVTGNSGGGVVSGGGSGSSDPNQEDKRRRMAEHERIVAAVADRDSREREREREREKELERLRQQEQQRAYYMQSGVQRAQTKSATDYHRGISIAPPPKVRRDDEKASPMKDLNTHQPFTLYSGFTGYPPSAFQKDIKTKQEMSLPAPPPLMSDVKHSTGVIVKHDTNAIKQSSMQVVHTPKQQQQQQAHYKTVSGGVPVSAGATPHIMYDYRVAQQHGAPHDRYKQQTVSVMASPQSTFGHAVSVTKQPQQQQQQQQQSQSPQVQQVQQPPPQVQQPQSQQHVHVQSKSKVSSPAPSHIYGKPSGAGIVSGIPVCRPQESSVHVVSKASSPSPFHAHIYGPPTVPPPPAHSSRSILYDGRMFTAAPAVKQSMPLSMHGTSPPTAAAAPLPISRSPGVMLPVIAQQHANSVQVAASNSFQTQPLDLGVSDRNRDDSKTSPKRKGAPTGSPMQCEVKKKRTEMVPQPLPVKHHSVQQHYLQQVPLQQMPPSHYLLPQQQQQQQQQQQNMPLALNVNAQQPPTMTPPMSVSPMDQRVASPLVTASTTVPYVEAPKVPKQPMLPDGINPTVTIMTTEVANNVKSPSVTVAATYKVNSVVTSVRVNSADGSSRTALSDNSSPAPSPELRSSPATPAKIVTEPEKSSSPAPKPNAPRHLKKAWLQRHTGEDLEDSTGITGGGSCVKLPLTLNTTPISNSEQSTTNSHSTTVASTNSTTHSTVHSIHNVGTMAINSINKTKTLVTGGKTNQHPKKSAVSNQNNISRDNGHNSDSNQKEDSSSSDQERPPKSPPKRKPIKVKRRKGGARRHADESKKKRQASESDKDSESDKESISDKDSDSTSASLGKKTNGSAAANSAIVKEPRKRGRRPKNAKDEASTKKKQKDETNPLRDPFCKPPISQLKKTGESFLQDGPCFEVAPKLAKCRECRWTPNQRSKNTPNIFCRFYAFRRLRYTKNGQLAIAGFSDPYKDPKEEDLKLWIPDADSPPSVLDLQGARFLLAYVADQFCDLVHQEKEAMAEHMADDKTIAWKRVVQGVREMCDVCETTLFNFHWACNKCGFVVCIDCYKGRKHGSDKTWGEIGGKDRDDFSWLLCTNKAIHEQEKLMLTQIIAGDSLQVLTRQMHEVRSMWNIPSFCGCTLMVEQHSKATNGVCKEYIKRLLKNDVNGIKKEVKIEGTFSNGSIKQEDNNSSALSWLAEVALQNEVKKNGAKDGGEKRENPNDSDSDDPSHSTLRELLIRPSGKLNGSRTSSPVGKPTKDVLTENLDTAIADALTDQRDPLMEQFQNAHYVSGKDRKVFNNVPIRIMTMVESKSMYPDVPHSWLCDGKLLRLMDPAAPNNIKIFQEQWRRAQPVLVSDVAKRLTPDLWLPESFSRDFGDEKNDLVNCLNGKLVANQQMRKFWDGFEYINKRLKTEKGQPMLLKLKDWPPGEDFAEMLPSRFADLMKALPLAEYTQRNGRLNLAGHLPDCFVRPDLGPKMYNAYGSALYPSKGTTNLHLDISDAVNLMMYVGIPKDTDEEETIKAAFRAIDEAGCDILTKRRVRDKGELPGALWHIYAPRDADKIRDLLNKITLEKGYCLEPHHDPIHDQAWYLDGPLRERLYKEYGVEGYPIAQCLGDAVFIPAGAPHQVRNLHNCIKVAQDFVSPENVTKCFDLTQEFRNLTDTHSNHEDKLQIKNIIYHAVKDAIGCLSYALNQRVTESQAFEIKKEVPIKKEIKEEAEDRLAN
ncbi:probable JmjC domain-containing histone demethylation protein 2C isoform X2 [Phlebotomus argentipes]|uniref:probable JmjC domain-containing histone demethylation protein 2C isoform X2 n=1 Tax=Phlebotomus argentipes TaxID=94469 RepID=UPI0028933624|nr:probable JmjC domain-containing histone demethylation protein 2C isoform X2 [Phlebotomus argentipes]